MDEEKTKPICQWSTKREKGDRVQLFQRRAPRKPIHADTELASSFYEQSQLYRFLSTVQLLPIKAIQEELCSTMVPPSYRLSPCPSVPAPPSFSPLPSPRKTIDSALIPLPQIPLPSRPLPCTIPPSREMLHLPYELDVPDVPSVSLTVSPFHRETGSPAPLPSPPRIESVTFFLFVHPSERRSLLPPLPQSQPLPSLPLEPLVAHPRAFDLFQYAGSLSDRCLLPTNLVTDVSYENVLLRELEKSLVSVHPLSLLSKTVVVREVSRSGSFARSVRQQFAGKDEERLPVVALLFSQRTCVVASQRDSSLRCEESRLSSACGGIG